ncbi:ABC transporter permease [Adlercreutzia sp. ZJ138]|uniref:ABC transporter permease n=1 Tax=Adlercreutzia sp. ZJ138 TaxID=2709405 RepID=UPI0013EACE97|nr:ABC transporter permease [Adlercreutzia sp. ZJ138]
MWNTFKYTTLYISREREILIWALAFPIILSTLFSLMFSGMDESVYATDLGVVVVEDEAWESDEAAVLREVMDAISEPGTAADKVGSLVAPHYVESEEDARRTLADTDAIAYLIVDEQGAPQLHMKLDPADSSLTQRQTVVKTVLDGALRTKAAVSDAVESHVRADVEQAARSGSFSPETFDVQALPTSVENWDQEASLSLDDASAASDVLMYMGIDVEALVEQALAATDAELTERVSITHNKPMESERYYYALLGMATLFTANIGMLGINRILANTSSVGARRTLGAASRTRVMVATCAATWVLSFVCLLVAYVYIRCAIGVTFGGKDAACVLALAASSLAGCMLGAFIGAIPGVSEGGKGGIITVIACFGALFAGLYGQACMSLADHIAAVAPWSVYVNPASLIARTFYSLYYYDSMVPYAESLAMLLVMAVVFLAGTALLARRQQHEHL